MPTFERTRCAFPHSALFAWNDEILEILPILPILLDLSRSTQICADPVDPADLGRSGLDPGETWRSWTRPWRDPGSTWRDPGATWRDPGATRARPWRDLEILDAAWRDLAPTWPRPGRDPPRLDPRIRARTRVPTLDPARRGTPSGPLCDLGAEPADSENS